MNVWSFSDKSVQVFINLVEHHSGANVAHIFAQKTPHEI